MARNGSAWRLKPLPGAIRSNGAKPKLPPIFDSSPVGMALLGADGRFLVVNPALCQMLGCDEEAFRQMTVTTLSHPEDASRFVAELGRLRSGEINAVRAERHLQRPDGRGMWALINVSPVRNGAGGPVNFFAHVADISERVRAQQEAELRLIQQTALTALWARALEGTAPRLIMDHAVRVVASCLAVKSATVFEVRGRHELVLSATVGCSRRNGSTPTTSAVKVLAQCALAASGPVLVTDARSDDRFEPSVLPTQGVVSSVSVPVMVAGQARAILSAHSPEPGRFTEDDVNFVLSVANTVAAVIERRFHEEAQERVNRQERLATMGQLAAGVAHDFNNIVSTIGLYADLVGSHHGLDAPSRDHLGIIQDQTERAKSLVWQVLDFVQGRPIVRTEIDLAAFFTDFLRVLRRQVPSGISIALHHDSEPYPAHVDPARMQQIVMNLVTNACDAMSGAGTLTITLSRRPADAGVPGLSGPGIQIQISDTGSGFATGVLERALEPFFTTKAADEGTGLGLAQVQSLVSQHDGHLAIDSVLGEGTTVTVWLPESDPRSQLSPDPVPATLQNSHPGSAP